MYILPYTHKYAFFTTYTFQSNLSGCRGVNTVEHVAISFMFVHFGADDFLKKERKSPYMFPNEELYHWATYAAPVVLPLQSH